MRSNRIRLVVGLAVVLAGGALLLRPLYGAGTPAVANGGPTNQLFMPQGSGAGTAVGDFVSDATGLNTTYHYFIESPAGLARLVVDLFDADLGTGGTGPGESAGDRDRQRTGAWDTTTRYTLRTPNGQLVYDQTGSTTNPAASDNAWLNIFDTNAPPALYNTQSTNLSAAGATSLALAAPSGSVNNDFLIAYVAKDAVTAFTIPGGWTSIQEGNCSAGGNNNRCRMVVAWHRFVTGDTTYTFSWTGTVQAVGAIFRYTGVPTSGNPIAASNIGSGAASPATAPTVTTTANNQEVIRFWAVDDDRAAAAPFPATHNPLVNQVSSTNGVDDAGNSTQQTGAAADVLQPATGATGTANFTLLDNEDWVAVTVAIVGGTTTTPIAGHWEFDTDSSNAITTGNDINAFGIRAHDGTPGAGGTEVPIYFDTFTQLGHDTEADGTSVSRTYNVFPWVTSGCNLFEKDFDFDQGNNTGNCTGGSWGQIPVLRPTGTALTCSGSACTVFPTPNVTVRTITSTGGGASMSANNAWAGNTIPAAGNFTTDDQNAENYGIWQANPQICSYTGGNANYAELAFFNFGNTLAGTANPTSNPQANSIRVYLPTDAGTAPEKPYMEQFARCVTNCNPAVNGTSVIAITVHVVNPTAQAITFSTPNNIVTADLPGSARVTYVGASAAASQGSIVAQPANAATAGSVTWNPTSLASAHVADLTYRVNVTPNAAGQRNVLTPNPALPSTGTRAQYVDETGNTTQSRATVTLGPLCALAETQGVPTYATVHDLEAIEDGGRVVVEWKTAGEEATAGFYLYRLDERANDWIQVRDAIVAPVPGAPQGGLYRVADDEAPRGGKLHYAIVEVEAKGNVRTMGPFEVEVHGRRGGPTADTAVDETGVARQPFALSSAEVARLSAAAMSQRAAESATNSNLRSNAVKVHVPSDGLYSVAATDLATTFGVPASVVRRALTNGQLRVEDRGQQVAWMPSRDFGALYFYGQATTEVTSPDNVYWVRLAAGTSMAKQNLPPTGLANPGSFADSHPYEQNVFAATVVTSDPESDYWFWDGLIAGDPTYGTRSFTIDVADPTRTGAASLTAHFFGASATGVADEHGASVSVNGTEIGTTSWTGLNPWAATFSFDPSLLVAGPNTISVTAETTAAPYNYFYVDKFGLGYRRSERAVGGSLLFRSEGSSNVKVTGFTTPDVLVYDLTNPQLPVRILGATVRPGNDGFEVAFAPASGTTPYLAIAASTAKAPSALERDRSSNLQGSPGADYVVIAPSSLTAAAQTFASRRALQGLSTMVVDPTDIYDEFNFGISTPNAIRAFLTYAWNEWSRPPKYVLLLGVGNYDYRNYLGLGGNLLPVLMTSSSFGLASADELFGDIDGDGVPEVVVGRIPAATNDEAMGAYAKIVAYEAGANQAWSGMALLGSDQPDADVDFAAENAAVANALAPWLASSSVDLGILPAGQAHDQFVADLNSGVAFVNYLGHGGLDRLAAAPLFSTDDVATLGNADRAPFFVTMTCSINRQEIPGFPSLGVALSIASNGGATAVWSPSGIILHNEGNELAFHIAQTAFHGSTMLLGDLVRAKVDELGGSGISTEFLRTLTLLGDPALRLPIHFVPPPPPGGGGPHE